MSETQPEAHDMDATGSIVVPVGTFDAAADIEMLYEDHSDRDSKRSSWSSGGSLNLEQELMDLMNDDPFPISDAEEPMSASSSSPSLGFGETDASSSEVTVDDDSQVGDEEGTYIDDSKLDSVFMAQLAVLTSWAQRR